jgi:hypothetical protein
LAEWLSACGIEVVAVESTGVYWIPLYALLESRWYGDLINLGREVGEGLLAGGGSKGGGGSAEDLNAVKEQLEMQKTQLTAILSILQRR